MTHLLVNILFERLCSYYQPKDNISVLSDRLKMSLAVLSFVRWIAKLVYSYHSGHH